MYTGNTTGTCTTHFFSSPTKLAPLLLDRPIAHHMTPVKKIRALLHPRVQCLHFSRKGTLFHRTHGIRMGQPQHRQAFSFHCRCRHVLPTQRSTARFPTTVCGRASFQFNGQPTQTTVGVGFTTVGQNQSVRAQRMSHHRNKSRGPTVVQIGDLLARFSDTVAVVVVPRVRVKRLSAVPVQIYPVKTHGGHPFGQKTMQQRCGVTGPHVGRQSWVALDQRIGSVGGVQLPDGQCWGKELIQFLDKRVVLGITARVRRAAISPGSIAHRVSLAKPTGLWVDGFQRHVVEIPIGNNARRGHGFPNFGQMSGGKVLGGSDEQVVLCTVHAFLALGAHAGVLTDLMGKRGVVDLVRKENVEGFLGHGAWEEQEEDEEGREMV
jgi:hypothetical protein